MRVLHRWSAAAFIAALAAALALPGAAPAAAHDRDVREPSESDIRNNERDVDRDARDAERDARDALEREQKEAADLAERSATENNIDSGSNSGSSNTSSDSGSSGSNSGSSNSGSSSDSSDDSGSNGGSSNSGSSNSGSDDDDDDEDEDEDDDSDSGAASGKRQVDVETDAQGRERRRGEFLVRGGRELEQALRSAGFVPLSSRHLTNLDASVVRVRVRENSSIETDIAFARRIAAAEDAEPNYVFRLSGSTPPAMPPLNLLATVAATSPATTSSGFLVGVVDTGADPRAPVLSDRIAATRGFGGPYTARTHGTYIAQILAREGVRVEVADVFQADAKGAPVATAESIARGIDWMAARGVPVVNVSITGPNSGLLSAVIARAIDRGTIVVAAAGNDGPNAPAVYPAAYPNVVGVTAVDTDGRIYRRANRGDYVDFAAIGVRVPVNGASGSVEYVSGTSYAAPLIAAAFARRYNHARPGEVAAEIARMQNAATDLGPRGRDPVFGWGQVSASAKAR